MSGWFSRAKEALSGRAVPREPEPIELECPCGRKIESHRREVFQRVLCKTCGEAFFVLPFDVYPRPVLKKPRPRKSDLPESSAKSAATSSRDSPARRSRQIVEQAKLQLSSATQRLREQFTALRLVVLCLVLVIGLTGWWQWNRAARSRAEVDFKTAVTEGDEFLKKNDLVNADLAFAKAADAADVLERIDKPAEQARQRHRELWAINNQLQRTLVEIMQTATSTARASGFGAAESEFLTLNSGRWLILHSEVAPFVVTAPMTAWEQRLQINNEVLVVTATIPGITELVTMRLASTSEQPSASDKANEANNAPPIIGAFRNDLGHREVVMAAEVLSLKWDGPTNSWRLTLDSDSMFLWSDFNLLLVAGFSPDELRTEAQWKSLLAEQSLWIGVAE